MSNIISFIESELKMEILRERGYVFVRNFFSNNAIEAVKHFLTNYYNLPTSLEVPKDKESDKKIFFHCEPAQTNDKIWTILEDDKLLEFFRGFYCVGSVCTRIHKLGEFTARHSDFTWNNPENTFTCWIPISHCGGNRGGIYLEIGNNRLESEMMPGDLLIFKSKINHGGSMNLSNQYRISMDVRWTQEKN